MTSVWFRPTGSLPRKDTMSELDSMAGTAVNAALIGVTLLPIGAIWARNLRCTAGFQSQVARMAHIFIQAALPVLIVWVWVFPTICSLLTWG